MIDLVGYVRFDNTVSLSRILFEMSEFLLETLGAESLMSDLHDSGPDNDGSFTLKVIGHADHQAIKYELNRFENSVPYMMSINYVS